MKKLNLYRLWWNQEGQTHHPRESLEDWKLSAEDTTRTDNPLAESSLAAFTQCRQQYPDTEWGVEEREFDVHPITSTHSIVLVNEEYGYRHWIWRTPFTSAQLVAFWRGLSTIPSAQDLPGEIEAASPSGLGDSYVWGLPSTSDPILYAVRDPLWRCHLHIDDDSHLTAPNDSRPNHHSGYVAQDLAALQAVAEGVQ